MDIIVITPARPASSSGNRITAVRWAGILRALGHRVRVATEHDGRPADLMIALHAWRSAAAIAEFREKFPERPLIVGLSGTDINHYLARDPEPTLRSLAAADRLVALHTLAWRHVPKKFRRKLRVIHQSAAPLRRRKLQKPRAFEVAVIGHLRDVKDPLRAAQAARRLPATSRLRIVHLGGAENADWAGRARQEMRENPRYVWRGEVTGGEVRRVLGRVQAMVLSSISEGGANVLAEAAMAGVPILASRIDAAVAQLGRNYPGFFPVGDTAALARLLNRIETDEKFLARLRQAVARRAGLFRPAREKAAWKDLIAELIGKLRRSRHRPSPC